MVFFSLIFRVLSRIIWVFLFRVSSLRIRRRRVRIRMRLLLRLLLLLEVLRLF